MAVPFELAGLFIDRGVDPDKNFWKGLLGTHAENEAMALEPKAVDRFSKLIGILFNHVKFEPISTSTEAMAAEVMQTIRANNRQLTDVLSESELETYERIVIPVLMVEEKSFTPKNRAAVLFYVCN